MGQFLFQLWILSFLLYQVNLVGSLSIDNLLVPILVLAWFIVGDRSNVKANAAKLKIIVFVSVIFLFLILIEFTKLEVDADMRGFNLSVIEHLKHFGYILIPILYISNEKHLKWTFSSLLVLICINSILAVLGATGIIQSFGAIGGESRIPGLLRARGPLVNDGDTALLISLISLMIWSVTAHNIRFVVDYRLVRVVLLLVLFAAIVATQSRNVILTVGMTFVVYYWLRMMLRGESGGVQTIMSFLGVGVFLFTITIVAINADTLITWVTNMFGMSGEGTVRDRIASYSAAVDLLEDSLLFGLSANEVATNSLFIAKLHNMWLGVALFSGVFGVLLVLAMVFVSLAGALRLVKNKEWKHYGLVLASFVLASLWFSPNFYPGHNAFIFWFCIGLTLTSGQTFYFSRGVLLINQNDRSENKHGAQELCNSTRILKYKSDS